MINLAGGAHEASPTTPAGYPGFEEQLHGLLLRCRSEPLPAAPPPGGWELPRVLNSHRIITFPSERRIS